MLYIITVFGNPFKEDRMATLTHISDSRLAIDDLVYQALDEVVEAGANRGLSSKASRGVRSRPMRW